MVDQAQASRGRLRLRLDPSLRRPLALAVVGMLAGAALSALLPAPAALPALGLCLGFCFLAAMLALDKVRSEQAQALARNVGELNVRLAATRIKLEGLQSRLDSEPLREADIAPTRASLAELTAEVGLLGGVLRDIATSVAEHENTLAEIEKARAAQSPLIEPAPAPQAPPAAAAPRARAVLRAEPGPVVDAELRRKDEEREAAILKAFEAAGVELHLQPIVSLPHRRLIGYEALARLPLPDGALLTPAEFLHVLERGGQSANLDAQVLTRALAIASHLNMRDGDHFVAINLTAQAWADLRTLHGVSRILETYRTAALRLVIEMPHRVFRSLDPARLGVVGAVKASGVRFGLDHLLDLRLDPMMLADRGVAFVKAPAAMLAEHEGFADGLDIAVGDLGQQLRRVGVELIGERAETDRLVADLIELDVRLAQGFAISPPRPVRQEVFQGAEAKVPGDPQPSTSPAAPLAPAPAASAPAVPEPPARVPFRSVLRRASA